MVLATVSILYQIGFYILLGFGAGVLVGVRVAPPSEDIEMKIGRLAFKVKGRKNTVTDGMDVTDMLDVTVNGKPITKQARKERIAIRRAARKARKNK